MLTPLALISDTGAAAVQAAPPSDAENELVPPVLIPVEESDEPPHPATETYAAANSIVARRIDDPPEEGK